MVFAWKRFNPEIHHRKSNRLKNWDYTTPGLYFITLCIQRDDVILGQVKEGKFIGNEFGGVVIDEWIKTPKIRPYVFLDEFVVMPNHFHGIIGIVAGATGVVQGRPGLVAGATGPVAPASNRPNGPKPGSIGAFIGQFKTQTTKRINEIRRVAGATGVVAGATGPVAPAPSHHGLAPPASLHHRPVAPAIWQRDYYDQIIWNSTQLDKIREYIRQNPEKWEK